MNGRVTGHSPRLSVAPPEPPPYGKTNSCSLAFGRVAWSSESALGSAGGRSLPDPRFSVGDFSILTGKLKKSQRGRFGGVLAHVPQSGQQTTKTNIRSQRGNTARISGYQHIIPHLSVLLAFCKQPSEAPGLRNTCVIMPGCGNEQS